MAHCASRALQAGRPARPAVHGHPCGFLRPDLGQNGIPFDNVDAGLVVKPLKWNPAGSGRFMLFFGPISSLFGSITFAAIGPGAA